MTDNAKVFHSSIIFNSHTSSTVEIRKNIYKTFSASIEKYFVHVKKNTTAKILNYIISNVNAINSHDTKFMSSNKRKFFSFIKCWQNNVDFSQFQILSNALNFQFCIAIIDS